MDQKRIDRISALSRKARSPEGLTEAEQLERASLRAEYVKSVIGNLESQLDRIVVVDEQGNRKKLRKEDGLDGGNGETE